MKSARVRRTGIDDAIKEIQSVPTAGQIRPGIKVLTRAAVQNIEHAKEIYDQGVAAGVSFDDIEKTLRSANPNFKRRPLTPKNVPYFRVTQSDFSVPGAAEKIMELYAEDRGDGNGRQLYSFPVMFPSDDMDVFFQEKFQAWKASQLFRWSTETPEGLKCTTQKDLSDMKGKRRRWGKVPSEYLRDCDPNDCPIFEAGECKHYGTMYFWIPAISGIGLIKLAFTSTYASLGISEVIEIAKAGLGSVQGMHNGKPIFSISKSLQNVSRVEWDKGTRTRQDQYIIRLEATGIEMSEVLSGPAPETLQLEHAPELEPNPEPESTTDLNEFPETEPETEPETDEELTEIAAIKKLRATLLVLISAFDPPWKPSDLKEWLAGNGYPESATLEKESLEEIIEKLQAAQS